LVKIRWLAGLLRWLTTMYIASSWQVDVCAIGHVGAGRKKQAVKTPQAPAGARSGVLS
jgi:hypothetical protein